MVRKQYIRRTLNRRLKKKRLRDNNHIIKKVKQLKVGEKIKRGRSKNTYEKIVTENRKKIALDENEVRDS